MLWYARLPMLKPDEMDGRTYDCQDTSSIDVCRRDCSGLIQAYSRGWSRLRPCPCAACPANGMAGVVIICEGFWRFCERPGSSFPWQAKEPLKPVVLQPDHIAFPAGTRLMRQSRRRRPDFKNSTQGFARAVVSHLMFTSSVCMMTDKGSLYSGS